MAAMVDSNDTEVSPEFLVAHEPVQVCRGGPTVQQDDNRGTLRTRYLAIEGCSSTREFNVSPQRQRGDGVVVQLSTFRTVTETLAPFSRVIDTLLPSD